MSKLQLSTFDPKVYPLKLFVATGGTAEELAKLFATRNNEEIEFGDLAHYGAFTESVLEKSTDRFGELVWFPTKSQFTVPTIAHEAAHVAINFCQYLDIRIEYMNDEPFAYLMGWIVKCIDGVRTNKTKNL